MYDSHAQYPPGIRGREPEYSLPYYVSKPMEGTAPGPSSSAAHHYGSMNSQVTQASMPMAPQTGHTPSGMTQGLYMTTGVWPEQTYPAVMYQPTSAQQSHYGQWHTATAPYKYPPPPPYNGVQSLAPGYNTHQSSAAPCSSVPQPHWRGYTAATQSPATEHGTGHSGGRPYGFTWHMSGQDTYQKQRAVAHDHSGPPSKKRCLSKTSPRDPLVTPTISHTQPQSNQGPHWTANVSKQVMLSCNICFSKTYNIILPRCGDQFCGDCIRKYFHECVKSSWGIAPTRFDCPVCTDKLELPTVLKYLDEDLRNEVIKKSECPQPFTRHCQKCAGSVAVVDPEKCTRSTLDVLDSHQKSLGPNMKGLVADIISQVQRQKIPADELLPSMMCLLGLKEEAEWMSHFLGDLLHCKDLQEINVPLQFEYVRRYPHATCTGCKEPVCLHCGAATHHKGKTCEDYAEEMLKYLESCAEDVPNDDELPTRGTSEAANLIWKLKNSKRCPQCCIFIQRDDGCNRMHCAYCGHRFCWVCRQPWSKACGYFQCHRSKGKEKAEDVAPLVVSTNSAVEAGVPDVQAKGFASAADG